jgi:hypothetical protein
MRSGARTLGKVEEADVSLGGPLLERGGFGEAADVLGADGAVEAVEVIEDDDDVEAGLGGFDGEELRDVDGGGEDDPDLGVADAVVDDALAEGVVEGDDDVIVGVAGLGGDLPLWPVDGPDADGDVGGPMEVLAEFGEAGADVGASSGDVGVGLPGVGLCKVAGDGVPSAMTEAGPLGRGA